MMSPVSSTHLLLIPSYNSGAMVIDVVKQALHYWRPVWVVVDGSDDGTGKLLDALAARQQHLTVLHHAVNRGKGSAVYTGISAALEQGYTHVLTMDADGQHPPSAIPLFMAESESHPQAMILGDPVFDASAPAIRVNGRKIANFWTHLETLGAGIHDALFGFRVYPLQPLKAVMDSTRFARRFDFEPEAAIRLVWSGVPIINRPVAVRYLTAAEGGVSHFNYLRDNVLLIWMYARLFFGFLLRLPVLVYRQLKKYRQ